MGLAYYWQRFKDVPPLAKAAVAMVVATPCYFYYDAYEQERKRKWTIAQITDKVYMDIAIADQFAGRLVIGLYGGMVPMTCENFLQLCKGYVIGDKMIGYKNTMLHQIKPGVAAFGGDVITGHGNDSGMSIYGRYFPDENFEVEFVQEGDVAMANWGKNSNASQFMITFCRLTIFYGQHVVFGTVLKGMKVVKQLADLGTTSGRPVLPVRIIDCGVMIDGKEPPLPMVALLPPVPTMSEEDFLQQEKDAASAVKLQANAAADKDAASAAKSQANAGRQS
eukprot:GEMP01054148.1.p1 GENE.GEMP01054148.1~~GEMP01054148.1.p1  ORF type:complete len:298 (+),score=54.90 GEMP01054148.1:58-894(+)